MTPITFRRELAASLLEAIAAGRPIIPPGGSWQRAELLQLSAACLCACRAAGPIIDPADSSERREFLESQHMRDASPALHLVAVLTEAVRMATYDQHFAAVLELTMATGPDGKLLIGDAQKNLENSARNSC